MNTGTGANAGLVNGGLLARNFVLRIRTDLKQGWPGVLFTGAAFYGHEDSRGREPVVWRSRPSALNAGEGLVCLASTTCSNGM